jgi:hypothetical protein
MTRQPDSMQGLLAVANGRPGTAPHLVLQTGTSPLMQPTVAMLQRPISAQMRPPILAASTLPGLASPMPGGAPAFGGPPKQEPQVQGGGAHLAQAAAQQLPRQEQPRGQVSSGQQPPPAASESSPWGSPAQNPSMTPHQAQPPGQAAVAGQPTVRFVKFFKSSRDKCHLRLAVQLTICLR